VLESRDRVVWEERDPISFLRERIERFRPVRLPGLPPLVAGAIGHFSYDMVRLIERIPKRLRDEIGLYDAMLMFYHGLVAFDHVQHRLWIVRNVFTEGGGSLRAKYDAAVREIKKTRRLLDEPVAAERPKKPSKSKKREPLKVTSNFRRPEYLAAVQKAKQYIRAGDIFQVVLSQRFSAKTKAEPFEIYRELRALNPSPYLFYLQLNDVSVVGSSPEMLVKVQGRDVFYRPIAGTRWRGKDEAEDQRLEREMLASEKERAEHIMLVDLGRNDLGRVCDYGTVKPEKLLTVERYSHVMHLVSSLRGRLREDVDCFFSGRHRFRRAESPRHGNHRRAGAHAPRNLCRGHSLPRFRGQSRFLHRASHHGGEKRRRLRASRRRHSCGFHPGGGISGERE